MPLKNLFGLTLSQLQNLCNDLSFPKFTARQIAQWLYQKRVEDIDAMTNLSLTQRATLKQCCTIEHNTPVHCSISSDGTKKYLFSVLGDQYIESVFIPSDDRATLCVSSQAGCRMGCRFCATGKMGFHGNLTASDILNQIFSIPESNDLTNIVFMGMGEPMDNLDNLLDALSIMTSDWGMNIGSRRITVSSVGVLSKLKILVEQTRCHVAVSLHTAVATERERLMPVQRAFPIKDVIDYLRTQHWSDSRRLSFEYTLMEGINDSLNHAKILTNTLKGMHCRVNLIRFHTSEGMPYKAPSMQKIKAFEKYLNEHGVVCTLRASRGEDIDAACGTLAARQ